MYLSLHPSLPPAFRLACGCASFGGRVDRTVAVRAIHAALDEGINTFDTARSYGYGEGESILAEALAGRPDVIVCTKVGIEPRSAIATPRAKAVARSLFRRVPAARRLARAVLSRARTGGHFSAREIAEGVETSLRALRRERIDVLFLHEIDFVDSERDEVHEALRMLQESGKVLLAGMSPDLETLIRMTEADRFRGDVVQFTAGVSTWSDWTPRSWTAIKSLCAGARVRFGNQPFRNALGSSGARVPVEVCLRAPLELGVCDLVVASMTSPHHVRENARALTEPRLTVEDIKRGVSSLSKQ